MKRRMTTFLLMTCLILQTLSPATAFAAKTPGVMYYSLNHNDQFVLSGTSRTKSAPSLNFSNYKEFTVDGIPFEFKVNKVTYNAAETANQPFTNFTRMASLANGQINTTTKTFEYSRTATTSHVKHKKRGFSFGASISPNKAGLTSKILSAVIGSSFGIKTSRSFTRSNTTTELTKSTDESVITLQVPNLPQYKDCNGVDFYIFTNTYVYDVDAVISMPNTTSNKYLGYTRKYYTNKTKSGRHYRCNSCGKRMNGGDMLMPVPDEPGIGDEYGDYEDTRIVHLDLASGDTAHCSLEQWQEMERNGTNAYKPYFENNGTEVSFRVYWPETQGITIPWYLENNPQINLTKPINLVPKGTEKIIYDNGKYYQMVIEDSNLIDSNYSVLLPGEQIEYPMLPGMTQNYKDSKTVATTNKIEKIRQRSSSISFSLVAKVKKFLELSGGHSSSKTVTNSSSTTTTESKTVTINNNFRLPTAFTDAGYDGATLYITESGLLYEINAKIYPINGYGEADKSRPGTLSMTQKVEFPKTYAKPYRVTP